MTRLLFIALALSVSCDGTRKSVGATADSGGDRVDPMPFRDEWRTVINQPFAAFDADGELNIGAVAIGGTDVQHNFANRGDVIVRYAPTDFITVEMRRFTMAPSQAVAQDDFDAIEIWAYDAAGAPKAPNKLDPADNCRDPAQAIPWRNGCKIRVYYEGLSQLSRTGADLRVTLPESWTGDLEINTEDNNADDDYHNRGNVCVEGLRGSVDIALGSGAAFVSLADDIAEMPRCPANLQGECADNGWDPAACPCLGGTNPYTFGQTRVISQEAGASNVTVDVPPGLWAAANLLNEGLQDKDATGRCADGDGACCDAAVGTEIGEYVLDPALGTTRDPWQNRGDLNFPGQPAARGGGYNLTLTSHDCQSVTTTEHPEDFVGAGNGPDQATTELGNLQLCAGCLRDTPCEELLPGS